MCLTFLVKFLPLTYCSALYYCNFVSTVPFRFGLKGVCKMQRKIKKIVIAAAALLILIMLSGCLQIDTVVRVNKDGSGVVERTFTMQKDILEMIKAMSSMESGGEAAEEFNLLDMNELEQEAGSMGEGVALLSAEPYETDLFQGYKAQFSFSDINTLRINQNPGENVPSEATEGDVVEEIITFSFSKKGRDSDLKIFMPKGKPRESREEMTETGEIQADELEMMKQIYGNMKMSMSVEVDGSIVSTNAEYQDESGVTLMSLDLGKVAEDEEKLIKLAASQTDTIEGLKAALEDVPGIKVELQEEVEVLFR